MSSIGTTLKIALVAAAIAPAAAFANSFWHSGAGELGAVMVSEHWQNRSGAELRAEKGAERPGGAPATSQGSGEGFAEARDSQQSMPLSRDGVNRRSDANTEAERKALRDIYVGG